jgi:hypothetical protein
VRIPIRVTAAAAVAAAAVVTAATPAFATTSSPASASEAGHAVFAQTDNTVGNRVVAYDRATDGTVTPAGSYATGGRGGILTGSVVDHTASQGVAYLRPAARPALRRERGQQHDLGLRRPR